jgi:uncharacterized membrane protein
MTVWAPPLCTTCACHRFSEQKQQAQRTLISLMLAFLLGGFFFTFGNPYPQVRDERGIYFMIMGAISAGTIAGWRYLSFKTADHTRIVWISSKGYATFLVLRLVMSVFIGTLLLPYAFYRAIRDMLNSMQAEAVLGANRSQTST